MATGAGTGGGREGTATWSEEFFEGVDDRSQDFFDFLLDCFTCRIEGVEDFIFNLSQPQGRSERVQQGQDEDLTCQWIAVR